MRSNSAKAPRVEHEPADGVVGVAAVGLLLFDELDRCALGGDLVDDVPQVTEGAGEPVHRCESDGVAVADVSDAVEQRGSVGAGAAGDLLFEQSVDVADGLELSVEVLID